MKKILYFSIIVALVSCGGNDEPDINSETENEALKNYTAPTYADDYSPLASWDMRARWNLANVHDPTVAKCGDWYYMYSTDASYGNALDGHGHFPYRRSKDLVNWEFMGTAMRDIPAWVLDTLNNMRQRLNLPPVTDPVFGYWAPTVRKAGDKYLMFYSIAVDNYILTGRPASTAFDGSWTERAFIGLMETSDLALNNWEDKGMVVCSYSDRGLNWNRPNQNNWDGYFLWNAIDPTFIITPDNEHWLIYGSWHSGIAALQLDPQTHKPLHPFTGEPWDTGAQPSYGATIFTRQNGNRWQGSEAPEIIYNEKTGYYYLFMAYDELSVAYNTRVFRSQNITGPYAGDKIITHPYRFNDHSGWVGISHCCIFNDGDDWFYASQGRLPANTGGNAYSNAIMMGHIRKIRWTDDGWPVVMPERYGAVPDVAINEDELAGTWEVITLNYQYQRQQTSSSMILTADKKASGAISGAWSYDAAAKTLTIGSQKLYIEREPDWESPERRPTIVFSGLNTSGQSLWGKLK